VNYLQSIIDLIPNVLSSINNKLQLLAFALVVGSGVYITTLVIEPKREITYKAVEKNKVLLDNTRKSIGAEAIAVYRFEDRDLENIYITDGFEAKDLDSFFEPILFEQLALGNCSNKTQLVFNIQTKKKLSTIVCPIGRKGAIMAAFKDLPLRRASLDGDEFDPTSGIMWNTGERILEENH
jgi:hypothetical protein